jgi:hypothetical protein
MRTTTGTTSDWAKVGNICKPAFASAAVTEALTSSAHMQGMRTTSNTLFLRFLSRTSVMIFGPGRSTMFPWRGLEHWDEQE